MTVIVVRCGDYVPFMALTDALIYVTTVTCDSDFTVIVTAQQSHDRLGPIYSVYRGGPIP